MPTARTAADAPLARAAPGGSAERLAWRATLTGLLLALVFMVALWD